MVLLKYELNGGWTMTENKILPPAGSSGNCSFTCRECAHIFCISKLRETPVGPTFSEAIELLRVCVWTVPPPSPIQSQVLGIRRAQRRLRVGWSSGWSANTGPVGVETLRGISHKASYRRAKDRNVDKRRGPLLSALEGIDQPARQRTNVSHLRKH